MSLIGGILLPDMLHALDLPKLAGKYQFKLVRGDGRQDVVGEIEITYFKDFRNFGAVSGFEALKFENEDISVIKDSAGKSMISDIMLRAERQRQIFVLDAKESDNSISGQPNSYTRLHLEVTDTNNLILSISIKDGTVPFGPHINLFPSWPKKPTRTIYLKRKAHSDEGKASGTPEGRPKGTPEDRPKFR